MAQKKFIRESAPRRKRRVIDQVWVDNRLRYRKGADGSRLVLDPDSGYLETLTRRGFTGLKKTAFIDRLRFCSNLAAIGRSVEIDIQAVYDAVALDRKFREDFIAAEAIENRSKQLNDELVRRLTSETHRVVTDLLKQAERYNK